MRPSWANLNEHDRAAFRATFAFLNGRLEERSTIDWALRLKQGDTIKRLALIELIDSPDGRKIGEPWRSAWRLIEESWNNPAIGDVASSRLYRLGERVSTGDRSGSLVKAIVDLVAPRLKVDAFSDLELHFRTPPKRPKKVEDLFSTGLTSGEIVDPDVLGLTGVADRPFLLSLAFALDAVVVDGLDIARRIGWDEERRPWPLGQLYRVYFLRVGERADEEQEPDEFHRGIARAVKLLHAVVSRLVDLDVSAAIGFVRRWKLANSPLHLRLWAALSRDPRVTPADEVGALLLSLDDGHFWDLHNYPEIAEVRARRFTELNPSQQAALIDRIRRRPPRNHWPKEADADLVKSGRLFWAVRELRRIEISGATLPERDKVWLDKGIDEFPDLVRMARLDEGFPDSPQVGSVTPNPDGRYDSLAGAERLKALEANLSSSRGGWDNDPARRAADWIRDRRNHLQVLVDLEGIPDGGSAFPRVWEKFAWAHSPAMGDGESTAQRDLPSESARGLALLATLPEATIRQSIEGISHWLYSWKQWVAALPAGPDVWFKIWPIAVEATNAQEPVEQENHLDTVAQSSADSGGKDVDTLNTAAGKLIGVFFAACPKPNKDSQPFHAEGILGRMRNTIIAVPGRSGLIARYRMIEELPYFLRADRDWTREHLITPLTAENVDAIALWRAIARRTRFSEVLEIIGGPMAERAPDRRLDRESRRSLVFSLVIECLHAFHEQRKPAVPYTRIQQMIRSLDDEVRAYGAGAVQRFVRDLSMRREGEQATPTAEELFRSAAAPFLQRVWPQERSLATPGVSRALADLPATAREAFAEAVDAIERFLVPFECWSMIEYGLYGKEDGKPKLSNIDNRAKALAFLRLLDLTIGTAEGSVIPNDLADALEQIRSVAPKLAEEQVFRRLETAARRV